MHWLLQYLNLTFVTWFVVGKIWCYNTSQP